MYIIKNNYESVILYTIVFTFIITDITTQAYVLK
jgi:hypothetical protein